MCLFRFSLAALFTILLGLAGPAMAQGAGGRSWVQIEAQPTLREAETRARAYAAAFPDVAGFRMASGWYAIVLGPYTPEAATQRLAALRAENLIPADSFIAGGQVYRAPFWPVGANPATAPLQGTAPLPAPAPSPVQPVEVAPLATAPDAPDPAPEPAAALPQPAAEPEETLAEARAAETRLTRTERQEIQAALQWAGYYTAAIDGAFGPGTRGSITTWQEVMGHEPTGYLTSRQRAQLLGERARVEAVLGLETVTEPEAGIEIALPLALVEFQGYAPPFVQYDEKGASGLRVFLISQPGDRATLHGLYDLLQTFELMPPNGRRTRGESTFSIEGDNGRIGAFATAELTQGLVKGYMIVWEPRAADVARLARGAMRASFKGVGRRALDPGLVQLGEGARAAMLAGMEVRRPIRSRSGFYVSATGAVVTTDEVLAGCRRLTLDRDTEARLAHRDAAAGLAVLTPQTPLAPAVVAGFQTGAPATGSEVAVAGYSYEDALPAPALTFGTLDGATGLAGEPSLRRVTAPVQPGDAGGPVLDASGAVLGMLLPRQTDGARQLPAGLALVASLDALGPALAAAGVSPATAPRQGALAPEDLTERATRMTVLVSCWE